MRVEKIVCGFTALVSFPFNCFLGGGDLPPRYVRDEKIVCGSTALVFFPLTYFLGGGIFPSFSMFKDSPTFYPCFHSSLLDSPVASSW